MRKIFIILPLLFSLQAFSQSDTTKYYKSFDYGWKHKRAQYDSALTVPKDTVNKNQASIAYKNGSFFGKDQFGYKPFIFQGVPVSDYIQNQFAAQQTGAAYWVKYARLDSTLQLGTWAVNPTGANGQVGYNTTSLLLQGYVNGSWKNIATTGSNDFIQNNNSSIQTANTWYNGSLNLGGSTFRPDYKVSLESGSNTLLRLKSTANNPAINFSTSTDTAGNITYNGISFILSTQGTARMTVNSAATIIQGDIQGSNQIRVGASLGSQYLLSIPGKGIFSDKLFLGANGIGVPDASGTDIQGAVTHISGGKSTGAGNGGTIEFYTTQSGTSGSTLNTESLAASINSKGQLTVKNLTLTKPSSITAAATTTIDLSAGNVVPISMVTNITTLTINNATVGRYYLVLTEDATGGRTIAWPASVKWTGGTAPTLSGANKVDIINLLYDGTNFYAIANLNY